jgi:hypothetical protein
VTGNVKTGEVVPKPPDDLPANERHDEGALARRSDEVAFLYEAGEKAEEEMSGGYVAIIDQILSAETPEQILTPVEVRQPRDVVGEPLEIFDMRLQRSEYEVGSPMYASVEAKQLADGEPIVVNCGQKALMAQLVRLKQLDAFPFRAYFRQTGTNAHGTPMYRLTTLPQDRQPSVPASTEEAPF